MFAQSNIIVQKFLSTDIKLTVDQNNSDALLATNLKAKPYIQNYVIYSKSKGETFNKCLQFGGLCWQDALDAMEGTSAPLIN